MLPSSFSEALIRCSPVVTVSYNFTFAIGFLEAVVALSSGKLKLRNSYFSPSAVAPRRPFRPVLNILHNSSTQCKCVVSYVLVQF